MTTAAMVIGLIPLLFASGAGANSRYGLGVDYCIRYVSWHAIYAICITHNVYSFLARNHQVSAQTERQKQLRQQISEQ